MIEMKIMCPHCKHQFTVQGKTGEKLYVTCPKCITYGTFYFPIETGDSTKIECFTEDADIRFKKLRIFNGVMGIIHMIQGILMLLLNPQPGIL